VIGLPGERRGVLQGGHLLGATTEAGRAPGHPASQADRRQGPPPAPLRLRALDPRHGPGAHLRALRGRDEPPGCLEPAETDRALAPTPARSSLREDPEAAKTWKTKDYPRIAAQAKKVGAQIFFCDEAGIRTDHHAGTTWGKTRKTPVIRGTGQRRSLNMISSVSPTGKLHFSFAGRVNSDAFTRIPGTAPARRTRQDLPRSGRPLRPQVRQDGDVRRLDRWTPQPVLPANLLARAQSRRVGLAQHHTRPRSQDGGAEPRRDENRYLRRQVSVSRRTGRSSSGSSGPRISPISRHEYRRCPVNDYPISELFA